MAAPIYIPTNSARGFPFLYSLQHLLFANNAGHSDQCEVYLIVVLICFSLITSDVEHLFMCFLAIQMSILLWRNVYLGIFLIFWLGCYYYYFFFLVLSCPSSLYILEINLLLVASFANIFSCSVGFLVLFMISFLMQKLLSLTWSHLFVLFLFSFL